MPRAAHSVPSAADRHKLRALIELTFPAGAVAPERIAADADDDGERLAQALAGRPWTQVPPEDWPALCEALPLFSQAGLRAYLGGFLRAALDDEDVRAAVVDWASPPERLAERRRLGQIATELDVAQRAAIADVLRFLGHAHAEEFPGGEPERAAHFWEPGRA